MSQIRTIRVFQGGIIGGSAIRAIDLGMVSLRDAAINGRAVSLIPYADGRLISMIRYVPGGTTDGGNLSADMIFATPNTGIYEGFGMLTQQLDTLGITGVSQGSTSINGFLGGPSQILDCGPLIPGYLINGQDYEPLGSWQADTAYAFGDHILDSADRIQIIVTNGVSGSTEPAFSTGNTSDGTAEWQYFETVTNLGTVHVIAEVIEGVSPMPPYPASIEFVDAPTGGVAGDPITTVTVIVKDQNGDPWIFWKDDVTARILLLIVGVGTASGDTSEAVSSTTGIATFDNFVIADAGTYVLKAMLRKSVVADSILSDPFEIT